MKRLLIVEDKESLGLMLRETVEAEGFEAEIASTGAQAGRWLAEGRRYVAVLTDLRMPGADGIAVLRQAKETDPDCPVIVMTAFGTIENAVEAMKLGAYDFIQKPIDVDYLLLLLRRCRDERALRSENLLLKDEFQQRYRLPAIIGESPRIVEVSQAVQKVAGTDSTVLLQGESGTGKELFARAIHQLSPRADRPFVAINCAAIPDTLIENELFGHEKGAFTGATGRQLGKFELADSGTIFLDEIGELGHGVQSKLLRVIQERRFERIGGTADDRSRRPHHLRNESQSADRRCEAGAVPRGPLLPRQRLSDHRSAAARAPRRHRRARRLLHSALLARARQAATPDR